MATDRELLKAFREQFNTGGLFTESNVLVLMSYARGDERKLNKGKSDVSVFHAPYQCPYVNRIFSCPYVNTSGGHISKECYECENFD
jgi:hypothetical protein